MIPPTLVSFLCCLGSLWPRSTCYPAGNVHRRPRGFSFPLFLPGASSLEHRLARPAVLTSTLPSAFNRGPQWLLLRRGSASCPVCDRPASIPFLSITWIAFRFHHAPLRDPNGLCTMNRQLRRWCVVGGNAISAFLSWRLQASNSCDVTLVWKSGFESVAQYGVSFKYAVRSRSSSPTEYLCD